jgi:hypothetical protein
MIKDTVMQNVVIAHGMDILKKVTLLVNAEIAQEEMNLNIFFLDQ